MAEGTNGAKAQIGQVFEFVRVCWHVGNSDRERSGSTARTSRDGRLQDTE
jgi:hypothetical protein